MEFSCGDQLVENLKVELSNFHGKIINDSGLIYLGPPEVIRVKQVITRCYSSVVVFVE